MRQFLLYLLLSAVASSGFAIKTDRRPVRVAILESSEWQASPSQGRTIGWIREKVEEQLIAQGFDAFRIGDRFEDVRRDEPTGADYYLEIAGSDGRGHTVGEIGVPVAPGVGADLGVIISRVAARLVLYDAPTLSVIQTFDLSRHNKTVIPTAVSIGRGGLWGAIALPIIERTRIRAAADDVAHDAATQIRGILTP